MDELKANKLKNDIELLLACYEVDEYVILLSTDERLSILGYCTPDTVISHTTDTLSEFLTSLDEELTQ